VEELHLQVYQNVPSHFTGIAIYPNGSKAWYIDDKLSRLDGPAVEYANGNKAWYIDNIYLTEDSYWQHPEVIEFNMPKKHIVCYPHKCKLCGCPCRKTKTLVFCSNQKCKSRKQIKKMFRPIQIKEG